MTTDEKLWSQLKELAAGFDERIAELEAEQASVREKLNAYKAARNRLRGPEKPKPPRPKRKPASPRKLLEIAETICALRPDGDFEEFAAADVASALGIGSTDTIRRALEQLRDMEFVARAGKRRLDGQTHGVPHQFYRVLDRDVIDQIRRTQ